MATEIFKYADSKASQYGIQNRLKMIVVTLGSNGVSIAERESCLHFPSLHVE